MSSLEDLFGKQTKRPAPPSWNNAGDSHAGVITEDAYVEAEVEINGSWEPLYLEKQGESWKRVIESKLTPDSERMALTQIVVPVRLLETGVLATFFYSGKENKAELMKAMADSGLGLDVGVGIQKTLTHTNLGRNKKMRGWETKLAKPAE